MNYSEACALLRGRDKKKVGNNTYLHLERDGSVVLRLHGNGIVVWKHTGEIVLSSCGWRTATTKDRLNKFGPVWVFQHEFTWYFMFGEERMRFTDGLVVLESELGEKKEIRDWVGVVPAGDGSGWCG